MKLYGTVAVVALAIICPGCGAPTASLGPDCPTPAVSGGNKTPSTTLKTSDTVTKTSTFSTYRTHYYDGLHELSASTWKFTKDSRFVLSWRRKDEGYNPKVEIRIHVFPTGTEPDDEDRPLSDIIEAPKSVSQVTVTMQKINERVFWADMDDLLKNYTIRISYVMTTDRDWLKTDPSIVITSTLKVQ